VMGDYALIIFFASLFTLARLIYWNCT